MKCLTKSGIEKQIQLNKNKVYYNLYYQMGISNFGEEIKLKEVKTLMKEYKANKASATPSTDKVLLAILAILLPPLAVYLHEGTANGTFWISVLLTLLFWIPGVIFALITVL